ncbi:MAG: EndoU domain-containing protein [Methylococcales bacterium]|nr:EndoU domain-containing protein [Methylococcales bacterium]
MNWDSIADTLSTAKDFGKGAVTGVWEGGKSMVEGVGQLAQAGYKTATDSAYRDEVFNKATDLAKNSANFATKAWKDPIGTAKSSWDGAQNAVNAVSDRYVAARDAAKASGKLPEFYGNVIGRGGFEVGTVFIPVGKLSKLGKAGEVVADTEKLANVEKTTASAAKIASELPETKLGSKIACPNTKSPLSIKPNRREHILNRHRYGTNKPNKTEFPKTWSDNDIIKNVESIVNDPNAIPVPNKYGSSVIGTHDGVDIRVDFYPNNHSTYPGEISTAYPINITANPPKVTP